MNKWFDDYVEELNLKLKGKIFFVEIGAMDGIKHDAMYRHIVSNLGWSGILVEPLPDMFAKLKHNYLTRKNLRFENVAITKRNGKAQITRIPTEKVNHECPDWADGISTFKPDNHIISRYDFLKPHAVKELVSTMTFAKLVDKYAIKRIDLLQIDTEGYDKEIFDDIWAAGFRPSIIKLEILYIVHMEILELTQLLTGNGYICFIQGEDLIAVQNHAN